MKPANMNRLCSILGWIVWACAASGQVTSGLPASAHRLGPGDRISIQVKEEPELTLEVTLDGNGRFVYPFLKDVDAKGATTAELADVLTERLVKEGYLIRPDVSVTLLATPRNTVEIAGAVESPGAVPVPGNRRLVTLLEGIDLLSNAGPRLLLTRTSLINHKTFQGELVVERRRLGAGVAASKILNVTLEPGDRIYLEKMRPVTIASVESIDFLDPGPDGWLDLAGVLARFENQSMLQTAWIAVVDRIADRLDVWFAKADEVIRENPRAQRRLWPGAVCFILDSGWVGVAPAQEAPKVVQAREQWPNESADTGVRGTGSWSRWYLGSDGVAWQDLEESRQSGRRGAIVEIAQPRGVN